MVFTTQIFIFTFFPLSLGLFMLTHCLAKQENKFGHFLQKVRARELIIIAVSFFFYAWAGIGDFQRLLVYILVVYLLAKWVESSVRKKYYLELKRGEPLGEDNSKKLYLSCLVCILAVSILIYYLFKFKYVGLYQNFLKTVFKKEFSATTIIAPLGISFITFSAISYIVDIYRNKATSGSIIDCALYLSFFAKVISGPIVLWQNFQKQIGNYDISLTKSVDGLQRIMIGFVKKVILADTFGKCIAAIGVVEIDWITALGTLLLYMLQIYYDFAGYSDIAIGLAKMFGVHFDDNFNFPYRSLSITEFWRRWHISLGNWFKEYVYFPLGGSRRGRKRTLVNLAVVFVLTGVWHGAGTNYLTWGAINAICVIIERLIRDKTFYKKTPTFVKYSCTMLIVMCFWQFFRFSDFDSVVAFFKVAFGITK